MADPAIAFWTANRQVLRSNPDRSVKRFIIHSLSLFKRAWYKKVYYPTFHLIFTYICILGFQRVRHILLAWAQRHVITIAIKAKISQNVMQNPTIGIHENQQSGMQTLTSKTEMIKLRNILTKSVYIKR